MDKNTLYGLLLMGAVIFGFMWLNKPSEEEVRRQQEEALRQRTEELAKAQDQSYLTIDSVSPDEKSIIESTVRRFGVKDSITGNIDLKCKNVNLLLMSDGVLSGSVTTDGIRVDLKDILTSEFGDISHETAAKAVKELRSALDAVARYQGFASYLTGDEEIVSLGNGLLDLEISNKGAMIVNAALPAYKTYDSLTVAPISNGSDSYGFILTTATQRFDTREFYFNVTERTDTSVTMSLNIGDGAVFTIAYTLLPDSYTPRLDVYQTGMEGVIPSSVATVDFVWDQKMRRNEAGKVYEERNSGLYYMFTDGDVDNLKDGSNDSKEISQRLKWIGYKNQFFSSVIIPRETFATATLRSTPLKDDATFLKDLQTEATLDYSTTLANPVSMTMFIGPNSYPLLSDLQKQIAPEENLNLTKLIPLGWKLFRWINTLIVIPIFDLLQGWIHNYGIIILILTLFIKLILFPFTYKSYMSQAKMRVLAPEIKEINDRYPGNENAMKRQQETMALYSRAGASPFSGCLPMLLQLPILIAIFNFFPSAIELRGQSFLWAKDLSAPDAIISWHGNIPLISSTFGNHLSLFCLLMTIINIVYTKITMQNQPGGSSMPGMKWMMYLMPVMFLVFFNNYSAGLSYYYLLFLLITIIQTYIFRKVVDEDKVRAIMKENAKKPRKKSGFMARLEEAQKRQEAMMRQQQKQQSQRKNRK